MAGQIREISFGDFLSYYTYRSFLLCPLLTLPVSLTLIKFLLFAFNYFKLNCLFGNFELNGHVV